MLTWTEKQLKQFLTKIITVNCGRYPCWQQTPLKENQLTQTRHRLQPNSKKLRSIILEKTEIQAEMKSIECRIQSGRFKWSRYTIYESCQAPTPSTGGSRNSWRGSCTPVITFNAIGLDGERYKPEFLGGFGTMSIRTFFPIFTVWNAISSIEKRSWRHDIKSVVYMYP